MSLKRRFKDQRVWPTCWFYHSLTFERGWRKAGSSLTKTMILDYAWRGLSKTRSLEGTDAYGNGLVLVVGKSFSRLTFHLSWAELSMWSKWGPRENCLRSYVLQHFLHSGDIPPVSFTFLHQEPQWNESISTIGYPFKDGSNPRWNFKKKFCFGNTVPEMSRYWRMVFDSL